MMARISQVEKQSGVMRAEVLAFIIVLLIVAVVLIIALGMLHPIVCPSILTNSKLSALKSLFRC